MYIIIIIIIIIIKYAVYYLYANMMFVYFALNIYCLILKHIYNFKNTL